MSKFAWVETKETDIDGIWVRVMKDEGERLLCELSDPFRPDVYVDKKDVIEFTDEQIF
jgi:hypothetical protein